MEKIPKQEYTTEFKERAVKHVKEGKSIGLSAGLVTNGLVDPLVYGPTTKATSFLKHFLSQTAL